MLVLKEAVERIAAEDGGIPHLPCRWNLSSTPGYLRVPTRSGAVLRRRNSFLEHFRRKLGVESRTDRVFQERLFVVLPFSPWNPNHGCAFQPPVTSRNEKQWATHVEISSVAFDSLTGNVEADKMETLGNDFNMTGSVMTKSELEEQRRKRGECLTCGRKCFQKKLFKMIPITDHGRVLNGRCLNCKPLEPRSDHTVLPAVSRPATREDLARFSRSQSNLQMGGPGIRPMQQPPPPQDPPRASNSRGRGLGSRYARQPSADMTEASADSAPGRTSGGRGDLGSRADMRSSGSMEGDRGSRGQRSSIGHGGGGRRDEYASRRSNGQQGASSRSLDSTRSATSAVTAQTAQSQPDPVLDTHAAALASVAGRRLADNYRARHGHHGHGHDHHEEAPPTPSSAGSDAGRYAVQYEEEYDEYGHPSDVNASSRSLSERDRQSGRTFNDRKPASIMERPDSGREEAPQRQSALNRGGAVNFKSDRSTHSDGSDNASPMEPMPAESSRTVGSLSSIEEDGDAANGYAHRKSSRRHQGGAGAASDFPDTQINSDSIERKRSSRSVSTNSEAEQAALRQIQSLDSNYRDILEIMQEHQSSALVQQESLKELSNLHLTSEDQIAIMSVGGLSSIVSGMRSHPADVEVQICGCRAIWNLSASKENQVAIAEAGGIDAILTAMVEFSSNAEVQEKAMAALSNLGAAEANQPIILELGGVQKIVDAMNTHSEDAHVQEKGCAAMTNLASHNSSVKKAITDAGGAGAVVIAMIMHPSDVDLQVKALRALRNMCANDDENKVLVANVGGIDAVIRAMQVHRDEPGVQEAGAWTLSNLAVNAENKAIIGESGGIDVIVRAMWVHTDNARVQEWACRALWTLSVDPSNKLIVTEVGGISAVVNAMQAHVDEATVQEKGCGVLSNLAANDDANKVRIVEEEALDAIVMAMVLHSDNCLVQDRACTVLRKLAYGPNIKPMQAANLGELVKVAADKFPDQCGEKAHYVLAML